jgi:hypothetical protein
MLYFHAFAWCSATVDTDRCINGPVGTECCDKDIAELLRIVLIRRIGDSERTSASTNGLRPRCIAGPKYLQKSE